MQSLRHVPIRVLDILREISWVRMFLSVVNIQPYFVIGMDKVLWHIMPVHSKIPIYTLSVIISFDTTG